MSLSTLPDLPYDRRALEPAITGQALELRHTTHHAAYVQGANGTLEQLSEVRASGQSSGLVGLEKALAFNLSGHVLHSIKRLFSNRPPDPVCVGRTFRAPVSRRRGNGCRRAVPG